MMAAEMKALRVFLLLSSLLAGYTAAAVWRDRQNTLEKYPEWKSTKVELGLGVNGARSFTLTPITMRGRSLNLGAWFGHQEVVYRESWDEFPEMKTRIYAEGEADWNLVARSLRGQPDFAFRVSNAAAHPSAWLKLGRENEFLETRKIPFVLPAARWVEISLKRADARVEAFVDGERIGSLDWPKGSWQIAFRGHSSAGVLRVDDIELSARGGKIYRQGFSGRFFFLAAVLAGILLFAFLLLVKWMAGAGISFSLGTALLAGSLLFLGFYDSQFAKNYPAEVDLAGYPSSIETQAAAMARLKALPAGHRPTLLWLGGSQAWGAGASAPAKSVFGRLSEAFAGVDFVNGAVSGSKVSEQAKVLRTVAPKRNLRAVVLTAGVNDAENPAFAADLESFVTEARKTNAALLLVAEPMESPIAPAVKIRQDQLLALAARLGIPAVNPNSALEKDADTGYLWWDFVHLSDSGAAVVAREMTGPLQKILRGKDK